MTRGQLLRGAAGAAVLAAGGGVARGLREHDDGDRRVRHGRRHELQARRAEAARPARPAAAAHGQLRDLGAARRQQGDPVRPRRRGRDAAALQLRRLHLPRRRSSSSRSSSTARCRSRRTTRPTRRTRSSPPARSRFDVVLGLSGSHIVLLQAKRLMQPLNHDYLPNLGRTSGPRCRARSTTADARYTVPYVVWSDGIGWRNDKIKTDIPKMKVPWDIFWDSPQPEGQGRPARRLPRRARACRCSATRCTRA